MVLVVAETPARRESLARAIMHDNLPCALADSLAAAEGILTTSAPRGHAETGTRGTGPVEGTGPYDVVVVDVPACTASALRLVRRLGGTSVATVLVCPAVSFDDAVRAMRAGANDVVAANIRPAELVQRVRCAVAQQRAKRAAGVRGLPDGPARAGRVGAMGEIRSREEPPMRAHDDRSPSHADSSPQGTPESGEKKRAVQKPATPIHAGLSASELADQFAVLVRGELDVEALLRQVLEFILAHVGPTNAAVFLPGASGEYSLGAYVNYSCPKETVEVLLDHLANIAAPRLESAVGLIHMTTPAQLQDHVGDSADWLNDSHMLGMACRSPVASSEPAECLAVFTLFRDRSMPFDQRHLPLLRAIGDVFGAQLARVIRIHHRHLPRDKWGSLGDPADESDDQGGLAA